MDQPSVRFDASRRRWVRRHETTDSAPVPPLEGELILSDEVLDAAGRDLGNIVFGRPGAVLRPASSADIAAMMKFCARHGIAVAARGAAHTTHGQGLAPGGLVIDMTALTTIHTIGTDHTEVDAGVMWRDLVEAAAEQGLRFPALTGYLRLTVGGTLSVGGVSPAYRVGGQVDRVRELEVVTGTGQIVRCGPDAHTDLFHAALAGLGQVGIITRAVIDLVPALPFVRTYLLDYTSSDAAFDAMRTLLIRREVDELFCMILPPTATTPPVYQLHVHQFHDANTSPDDKHLLRALPAPADRQQIDEDYVQQVTTYDAFFDALSAQGWDDCVKPWFDVFLPDKTVQAYVAQVVSQLTEEDWSPGVGFVLAFPHETSAFHSPRLRIPEDDHYVWLFDILGASKNVGPDPEFATRMLERNRMLFETARSIGGVRYPIGSQAFDNHAWEDHYGATWPDVTAAKKRYDPTGILTPGPAISTLS
ncbi:FAD/FMN-containing dehydrogenase [Kibdelosporangium banguiense]|uniref:FAD/FMN-containing dehydrogenase n=1 Tax=Kibdelosporangium banguiense TaxID=1365924 RepID=A0ABS4TWS6_9PSEU|nr:FAD-binding protein [Kibdelosporangium banguiense]MBP2328863.1 FAD/FMN-containing dehydrogenase [Kibdelosporangium banguiense]